MPEHSATSEAINYVYNSVAALISSAITVLILKRKRKADAIGAEISNVSLALEIWRKTSTQLSEDIRNLTLKIEQLQQENEGLRKEMNILKDENNSLRSKTSADN